VHVWKTHNKKKCVTSSQDLEDRNGRDDPLQKRSAARGETGANGNSKSVQVHQNKQISNATSESYKNIVITQFMTAANFCQNQCVISDHIRVRI
jgi:hypothetical protein